PLPPLPGRLLLAWQPLGSLASPARFADGQGLAGAARAPRPRRRPALRRLEQFPDIHAEGPRQLPRRREQRLAPAVLPVAQGRHGHARGLRRLGLALARPLAQLLEPQPHLPARHGAFPRSLGSLPSLYASWQNLVNEPVDIVCQLAKMTVPSLTA